MTTTSPFFALPGRVAAGLSRELRIRRDTRRLRSASDATLKDLGIHRSEIEGIVRHGEHRYNRG